MEFVKPAVLAGEVDDLYAVPSFFVEELEKHFQVVLLSDIQDKKVACGVVAILFYFNQPKITKALLESLPNLKLVAVASAGYNSVNVQMVHSFGAKVSNVPFVQDETVADFGMALLMTAGRNICEDVACTMSPGQTKISNRLSKDINRTTLGIVGMGGIGFKIAERAKGFHMKILYHNRNRRSCNDENTVNATYYERLNDMLPLCDYVMISAKLTPETQNMMGAEQFKLMKNTSVLVNISRGAIVNHDALASALSSGEIHFAALDVTEPEPLPQDHPLLKMRNVIITPHVAAGTLKTRQQLIQAAIDNILAAIEGRTLPSEVLK